MQRSNVILSKARNHIDTIRLILFLQCNMRCSYCCNEQEQFNSQFQKKKFDEIDFNLYKNVCISGGEPFLYKDRLYHALRKIPTDKNIFIYTNGIFINAFDLAELSDFKNIKCFNVGLHHINQLKAVIAIDTIFPTRFMLQDIYKEKFLQAYPDRLNDSNIKTWKLNDCNMPNEDWVLLNNN